MKASVPLWLSVVASRLTVSGVSPSVVASSARQFSSDSAVSSVLLKTSVELNPGGRVARQVPGPGGGSVRRRRVADDHDVLGRSRRNQRQHHRVAVHRNAGSIARLASSSSQVVSSHVQATLTSKESGGGADPGPRPRRTTLSGSLRPPWVLPFPAPCSRECRSAQPRAGCHPRPLVARTRPHAVLHSVGQSRNGVDGSGRGRLGNVRRRVPAVCEEAFHCTL